MSISESLNSLESLGWQESEEEALFEQFGRSAERTWNTTELCCYCVCPISSHRAAAHKYSFPLVFLIGYIAVASLHFLPSASWPIKFITYTRSNNEVHSAYSHGGASLFKEETFHMRICLSKLVVTMQWLFKALRTQRWKMDADPLRTFQHAVVHSA